MEKNVNPAVRVADFRTLSLSIFNVSLTTSCIGSRWFQDWIGVLAYLSDVVAWFSGRRHFLLSNPSGFVRLRQY